MTWAIIADSSCNLRSFVPTAPNTSFHTVPLTIQVGQTEYVDDETLDVPLLRRSIAREAQSTSSSCPSAGEWAALFRSADNVIAVTLSSNLSGSYEAALMARNIVIDEVMRENGGVIAGKNIFVLDSKAAGGKLELIVTMVDQMLAAAEDPAFDEVVAFVTRLERASSVLFSLSSYENLVKGGRMPRLAGALASRLSIRLLGCASRQGTIKVVGSTHSEKRMVTKVVDHMERDGYQGGFAFIDHVENPTGAEALKTAIIEKWPDAEVEVLPCGGLCSYYAEESGLIIGYEWLQAL